MSDWIHDTFSLQGVVATLLLLAAVAMIGVIYTLRDWLPAPSHPGARRLGWKRSLLFLGLPLLPYWNLTIAFTLLPACLLMAAFELERLWLVRALGPDGYQTMLRAATARATLGEAVYANLGAGLMTAAAAIALWFVAPSPERDWGFWFAAGLMLHAVGNTLSRIAAAARAFRQKSAPGGS